jgi:glycosidase
MDDFIFGGIEADIQQRLAQEQARWSGLRHRHVIDPLDPQPGQAVTVTVFAGPDVAVDRVSLYLTTDGSDPAGRHGIAANGVVIPLQRTGVHWEALLWDYVEVWQGQIQGQPDHTFVQYRIEGWCSYEERVSLWSREPNMERTVEQPALYGYHVDHFQVPSWAYEAIVYHIFVDRFAITGTSNADGVYTIDPWLEAKALNTFVGGTLRGVIDRLDYIAGLGMTVLWLSPIFRTPSYHGYDTTDYYTVDPRFGSNDDLRTLVTAAHDHGLRVILDFVANHTSTEFAPFVQARNDPGSPCRPWFHFDPGYKHGYRTFFGEAAMPQINTDHPAARRFLIDAACYWLSEYDVDGYRLDYAAGPSHAFWSEFRAACRRVKPDCWLFGEVTLAGDDLRTYAGRLDGCLDFALCRLLRQLCTGKQPSITIAQFANAVERSHRFFYGSNLDRSHFILPSFLDNHDMNRFLWMAGNDKERLRMAATLLFALGGAPILYYGTEVGLSQPRSKGPWREEARQLMLWGDAQDQALLAEFKRLIRLRRTHPALVYGDLATRFLDDQQGVWLVERRYGDDVVLVAVNAGEQVWSVLLPDGAYRDLDGSFIHGAIELAAQRATILLKA